MLRHLTLRNTLLVLVVTLVSVNVGSHVAVQSAIAGYTIGSERYEQLALTYEHNSDIALLEGALNRIELELALVLDPRVPPVERDNHLSRIGRLDRDIHTMFLVLLDEVTSSASHESLAEAYRLYQSSALTRNVELIPAFLQGDDATARRLASELRSVALTEFSDHIRRAERMSLARLRDEEQSLILDHERLVGVTWWVVGLAGALALGVALFLVASITQPLNQLLRGMQGLAESHWKHRFADRGVGELAEIGRGLNELTETVRAHLSSLDEAHGRFRALVDANPNPLILVNLDGTIQQVNPAVEHIFGYAEDELVGQPVELLLPDSVRAGHVALREGYMARPHVRTMGRDGLTLQGKCKDGRLIDVEASLAPLIVDGQQQFLAEVQDVGWRRRLERDNKRHMDELEQSAGRLEETNASLERFAYICSHDLQEPVRTIHSFAALLTKRLAANAVADEKVDKYIHFISDGSQRAREMIADVLKFCRVNADTEAYAEVDLAGACAELAEMIAANLEDRHGRFEWQMDPPLPTITAVPGQLRMLLLNLVNNGLKFNRDANPTVTVRAEPDGDWWLIEVADNGIGIPVSEREDAFEIFRRLNKRSEFPGTGLGLAICRKIVDQHHGSIEVLDGVSGGTVFRIRWPLSADVTRQIEQSDTPSLAAG